MDVLLLNMKCLVGKDIGVVNSATVCLRRHGRSLVRLLGNNGERVAMNERGRQNASAKYAKR